MGRYSNRANDVGGSHVSSLASAIAKLHVTQNSNSKYRHGPRLPRRPISRQPALLENVLLSASSTSMDIDGAEEIEKRGEPIWLMQIHDLLEQTCLSIHAQEEYPGGARACHNLVKACGLSSEMHYTFLHHWQTITCHMLSSPVFTTSVFWSHHVLIWSIRDIALHCALLAVASLQYVRVTGMSERRFIQSAYRLYAEAERRLRYTKQPVEDKILVATHVCLLFFDYISGNQDAWENRLFMTKWAMRRAEYTNVDALGRYFFYTVARQDSLSIYTSDDASRVTGRHLAWDGLLEGSAVESMGTYGAVDQIGILYAELLRLHSCLESLAPSTTEQELEDINSHLSRWKESFPLDLQTYAYTGDVHDKSCFLHALTCAGGSRAVALHCLFSEFMIWKLEREPSDEVDTNVHVHAVTICRLVQSLTSSAMLLDDGISANLNMVLGALYTAGKNLFSKDGKEWLYRLLDWISRVSGNSFADKIADVLRGPAVLSDDIVADESS